jgi:arabinogalactan oligomer/maltooligosaccharide transport system substrate-binding protein
LEDFLIMKYGKFVLAVVAVLLAVGSFGLTLAQDGGTLVMWSQDGDVNDAVLAEQFKVWAETTGSAFTLEIVNKETEVLRNDLQTAGLAGSGLPDMVLGPNDAIGVFVDSGLLQPLDDLFDMSMYPINLGAAQVAGATYGVPTNAGNHLMLMYNKSLVEKAPDTWEELIATARSIEEANPGVRGFAYNLNEPFWFLPFVHGFGGGTYDADGNMVLDSQAWIDAYQFVQDLKFKEQIVPSECDYACADGLFKEGSVAMIINGDWAIGDYKNLETSPALGPDNLGLAPWPKLPNGERPKPFTAGKFISIPVGVEGEKLDAVVSFVTWLTTDPAAVTAYALGTSRLPAIDEVTVDPEADPLLAASNEALLTGVGMPADPTLRCMWDSVRPQLEGVMSNNVTPADAAMEAQISAEECIEG